MSQSASQLHLIESTLSLIEFKKYLNLFTKNNDSFIFLNDSVYVLLTEEFNSHEFINMAAEMNLFVLTEHFEARAVKCLPNNISKIEYTDFVHLSVKAHKVISW